MSKDNQIKNIVIVGGGTAGWMAASALTTLLSRTGMSVTLIESEAIPSVGVGEATIPQISLFNDLIGLDENDFMKKTGATFKLGIEFTNWGAKGESYIHPFGNYGFDMEGISFHHFWKRAQEIGNKEPLSSYCLQAVAAKSGKFMRPENIPNSPLAGLAYAFHFDAGRYAQYLRGLAEERGAARIEGKVVDVTQNASSGHIESLTLEDGAVIAGDLFIDCSGFYGLLIEKTLKAGYTDWSHWLPVNRAVAAGCEQDHAPYPYTRATAHDAGWQWRIPLQHRLGNGYVYCDKFITPQEAEDGLMSRLEGKPLSAPKHLNFTTGRRNEFWKKNCVALGLSAGFMEPLESTSIHLVQSGLARLMSLFPDKDFNQNNIDHFNTSTAREYELIRDFLILHYKATAREDTPFWKYVKHMDVPEAVTYKMDLFKGNGRLYRQDLDLFTENSWLSVMVGQNIMPGSYHPMVHAISDEEILSRLSQIKDVVDKSDAYMPMHADYIKEHCAAPDA